MTREQIHQALETMPAEKVDLKEFFRKLTFLAEIEVGLEDKRAGRVTSQEDFERESEEWGK